MKLLSFTIVLIVSFSAKAVEFYRCTDNNGQTHYTNLSLSSLDSNCVPKNHYSLMLIQDYKNLPNEIAKYDTSSQNVNNDKPKTLKLNDLNVSSEIDTVNKIHVPQDNLKDKIRAIFDPDKALQELVETSQGHDDSINRSFKRRSEGIQTILDQENPDSP